MTINCGVFVIAKVLELPPRAVEKLLRKEYTSRNDWLRFAADESIDSVQFPDCAMHLLESLGVRTARWDGQDHTVQEWAGHSAAPQHANSKYMLTVRDGRGGEDPHALVAYRGKVFDNAVPWGLPGPLHPYAPRPVYDTWRVVVP